MHYIHLNFVDPTTFLAIYNNSKWIIDLQKNKKKHSTCRKFMRLSTSIYNSIVMKQYYLVYNNIDLSYTNSFTGGGPLLYKISYVWPGAQNLQENSGQLTHEKDKEQGSHLL